MYKKITTTLLLFSCFIVWSQSVNICWDTSMSMKDRDITKDFNYLSNYFAQNNTTEVQLIQFKNGATAKETVSVSLSNWDVLKSKLSNIDYDGPTSYQGLNEELTKGTTLLFTDGEQTINSSNPILKGNLIIINSNPKCNIKKLNLLASINNGTLVNLAPATGESKLYTGKIISRNNVVEKARVSVRGKAVSAVSKADGTYQIEATPGDVLIFNSEGRKSTEKTLGSNNNVDVFMEGDGIELGEVFIETKIETPVEAERKMTANGEVNNDALGYSVESIGDDRITEITTTVSQAVQGKFNSVEYGSGQDLSQAVIRGMNSFLGNNYALIVVDGVALRQSNSSGGSGGVRTAVQLTDFIDPNTIGDITVLKGLAAANRWGSAGKNGVILITTKLALENAKADRNGKKVKNTALLTDNIYEGKIKSIKTNFTTPYLKELKKEKTIASAYETYVSQRPKFATNAEYYIDVADYFEASNTHIATQILSNILEDKNSSLSALKGLVFKANQKKNYELELEAANRILELYPEHIQSYLDVALANKHAGNYQVSMNMLNQMSTGAINTQLDFSGLSKIIDNELKNLIAKHRGSLQLGTVSTKYIENVTYDARLTFAWNNPDAEFDLQFVNPQKRFFNWEHTMNANAERLESEKVNGFTKEEFLLIGAEKGQWLVNAIYKGESSNKNRPTFLNCTVEYNFGKPNQRTEEFLIRLHEKGSEETLATIFLQ